MNNVIFARTRHHYVPYDDFYGLAELADYEVKYLDEVDWFDESLTVICPVKHPEMSVIIPHGKKNRMIWWNLERGIADAALMDMASPYMPWFVDEVWASDPAYARSIDAKYVFLGGHRAFGGINVQAKQYDIVTLMYYSGRRQRIGSELKEYVRDYRLADIEGGLWGDERHQRLMQTRLMVSAHQDDKPYSEPIRFMIAGCYALPLLSETCEDSGYWVAGQHYAAEGLDQLTIRASYLLDDAVCLARMGAAAWRLVCVERPFRSQVEAAL
jgi:hypothetical protein